LLFWDMLYPPDISVPEKSEGCARL
jgi:hypothetical protein